MKKKGKLLIAIFIVLAVTIVLNLIAFSESFCNSYKLHIYPVINSVVGKITSVVPVSVGEIFMYVGAILVVFLLLATVAFIFLNRKTKFRRWYLLYVRICALIISLVLLAFTLNWSIPIRGSVLKVTDSPKDEYTFAELEILYKDIVNRVNMAAQEAPRDENGKLICDFNQDEIISIMSSNSDRFPLLAGSYNKAKPAMCSDILDFMGIGGYNYVYSMEPTYNIYCDKIRMPVIICHELCHNKGYYLENEAEFLSSVVLAESENKFLAYSALLEMYNYVEQEFYEQYVQLRLSEGNAVVEDYKSLCAQLGVEPDLSYPREFFASALYFHTYPQLSDLVYEDLSAAYEESAEFYEENVNEFLVENTQETFEEISVTGWEIQGNLLAENSYDGLTLMLLQYYIKD